jgi:hypothetical protein
LRAEASIRSIAAGSTESKAKAKSLSFAFPEIVIVASARVSSPVSERTL